MKWRVVMEVTRGRFKIRVYAAIGISTSAEIGISPYPEPRPFRVP
jgi:hypothetical protein